MATIYYDKDADPALIRGKKVAVIERDTENVKVLTEAEIEKMKAEYGAKIAEMEADRKRALGEAEAEAKKMTETAKGALYKMKMDVFRSDGDAFLRYTMSQELSPKMRLRLFHSGPGTLWTNMGDAKTNLFINPYSESKEKDKK